MLMGKSGKLEETIIAQGVRMEGEFVSEGDVYIEGEVRGLVKVGGDLRVGEHARIDADIRAQNAVVSGKIQGDVTIVGKLDLLETGTIHGNVQCETLNVNAGAKLHGTIVMDKQLAERERKQVSNVEVLEEQAA